MTKQSIERELKAALKNRDEVRLSVFRMLAASIKNKEIEKRTRSGQSNADLSDDEITSVIRTELKKRKDAIEAYEKGGRTEQKEQEMKEAAILSLLLPQELSDEELQSIVEEAIETVKPSGEKDFGRLMGAVMARAKGRVSGDRVSDMVKKRLESR